MNPKFIWEVSTLWISPTRVDCNTNLILEIEEFRRLTSDFLDLVDKLAAKVEREKMRAIGAHNVLQSMEKEKEINQEQFQVCVVSQFFGFAKIVVTGSDFWENVAIGAT